MAKCAICKGPDAVSYKLGNHPTMMLCPNCIEDAQRKAVQTGQLKDPPYRHTMRPKWMQ